MTKRMRPATAGAPTAAPPALAGYAIGIVSEYLRHPVAAPLASSGARLVAVQAVRTLAQPVEAALKAATMDCLTSPIDQLMVTSAVEFNFWMAALRRWRLDVPVLARFAHARLLASNPRCADSLRDLGFTEIWSTADATVEALVRHLRAQPLAGKTVAVQVSNPAMHELCQLLSDGGIDVVEVPTYQVLPSNNPDAMRRSIGQMIRLHMNALVVTSAAAAEALLWHARVSGQLDRLLQTLEADVPVVCPGRLAAAPLRALGVPVHIADEPDADRLSSAIHEIVPSQAIRLQTEGHLVEIRGEAVVLDGRLIPMQQGPIAVLRLLAQNPNRVLSPTDLRQRNPFWSDADDHAIEMAVSRLRRYLKGVDLVQTVIKRGYRLVDM